jgi:hypothetical protein
MQTHGLVHKRVSPTGLLQSGKVVPTSYALVLQMIATFAKVDWSARPTSTQVKQTSTKNGKSTIRYVTLTGIHLNFESDADAAAAARVFGSNDFEPSSHPCRTIAKCPPFDVSKYLQVAKHLGLI